MIIDSHAHVVAPESLYAHRAMLLAHAATTPSMRHDAAPKMQQQDDWPANLILGRLELRSAPARTPIAV